MILSLSNNHGIAFHIFAHDEPGITGSSDAETAALADGVVGDALMCAKDCALESFDGAGGVSKIAA